MVVPVMPERKRLRPAVVPDVPPPPPKRPNMCPKVKHQLITLPTVSIFTHSWKTKNEDGRYDPPWVEPAHVTPAYVPKAFDILGEKLDKAFFGMSDSCMKQSSPFPSLDLAFEEDSWRIERFSVPLPGSLELKPLFSDLHDHKLDTLPPPPPPAPLNTSRFSLHISEAIGDTTLDNSQFSPVHEPDYPPKSLDFSQSKPSEMDYNSEDEAGGSSDEFHSADEDFPPGAPSPPPLPDRDSPSPPPGAPSPPPLPDHDSPSHFPHEHPPAPPATPRPVPLVQYSPSVDTSSATADMTPPVGTPLRDTSRESMQTTPRRTLLPSPSLNASHISPNASLLRGSPNASLLRGSPNARVNSANASVHVSTPPTRTSPGRAAAALNSTPGVRAGPLLRTPARCSSPGYPLSSPSRLSPARDITARARARTPLYGTTSGVASPARSPGRATSPSRAKSPGRTMSPGRILTPALDDYNTQPMEIDGESLQAQVDPADPRLCYSNPIAEEQMDSGETHRPSIDGEALTMDPKTRHPPDQPLRTESGESVEQDEELIQLHNMLTIDELGEENEGEIVAEDIDSPDEIEEPEEEEDMDDMDKPELCQISEFREIITDFGETKRVLYFRKSKFRISGTAEHHLDKMRLRMDYKDACKETGYPDIPNKLPRPRTLGLSLSDRADNRQGRRPAKQAAQQHQRKTFGISVAGISRHIRGQENHQNKQGFGVALRQMRFNQQPSYGGGGFGGQQGGNQLRRPLLKSEKLLSGFCNCWVQRPFHDSVCAKAHDDFIEVALQRQQTTYPIVKECIRIYQNKRKSDQCDPIRNFNFFKSIVRDVKGRIGS